ncbi:hypothetical protein BGZ75_004125 [Mortierella antarctica]|nr:hypothetical protein BGZ75_004125 [Mortierella antarctica]
MFEPIPPSNLLKIYKGCSNCRTQKIKCNGQEPCSRCRAFGLQCQYIVLPNQAAHRLAALAAASAPSPSGAVPTPASAATSSSSTPSPAEASTPSSSTSPTSFSRTRTSKKKRRSSSVRKSPDYDNNALFAVQEQLPHPDSLSTLTSAPALPGTPTSTQNPSGVLNVILHSMITATDQKGLANMEPLGLDEPCPSPEVMRRLIENYLRYLHPMQCIVDEKIPDFWTRLERPMEPEVASIVYAMCTIGAMFMSVCGSGKLDDQVPKFYRRTCAAQEGRPHDIITIQTFLILHSFFTLTLQLEELAKSFQLAMDISEKIKLGEAVQKLRSKDRLSPGEVTVRNTWRLLIWVEIFRNMSSPKNKRLEPLKDLTGRALDTRPEEVPTTQSSLTESMYFHTTNLFKVFQRVTRIKTPMSPRDVHAVNSTLDEFTGWHCSLPRHLRANSSRSQSTIGTGAISPYAFTLDLYYRVGHILLLNNLPYSIRSSPTGLGPRRESPLRILATSANSITATMGDLVKEPELRNYCLPHGVRSLTEAATIQQFNSKETDPAISTPAKINILKTLWCIRQFNFTVPTNVLNAVLEPFDTAAKASSSALRRDRKRTSSMMVDVSRPRTPSISAMSMESPTSSAPSHDGRGVSMASDYSSSAASTREGSHTTIYETDCIERDRPFRLQTSPSQDGAAASLLALSLESPTGIYRSGISPTDFSAEACTNTPSLSKDVRKKAPCSDIPESIASPVQPKRQYSREELYEGKRSRSSSVSVVSPKIEEISTDLHAMLDIQPTSPLAQDSPSPSTTTHAHLNSLDDQEQKDLEEQNASHLIQFAPKPQAAMENLLARKSFDSIHRPDYESRHRSLYGVAHQRSSGPSSQSVRLSDFQENGIENTMLFAKGRDELMPAATTLEQDRSQTDGATILRSAEHPAHDEDIVGFISASQQRPLSPLSSPRNDSRLGPKISTGPVSNSGHQGDAVSKGSLQAGEDYQATTRVRHPDLFPLHEDRLVISSHAEAPRKRQLVHQGDHELQQERIRRAGSEKLHLNTVVPSHPYRLDKKSPRTPLSASSDMGKLGYKTSPITSRSGSESDLAGLGAGYRTKSQAAPVYHNHPSNPPSARSSISSMDISPHMPSRPSSRAGSLQSSALSRLGATEVTGSAGSVQEREHHLKTQQLPGHVQPHHLQYWSQHAGPLHEAEKDLEWSIHQPTSVIVGLSGHDHDSRMTVAPTSSSSPIPAGFISPLSPQSPRSTREQVRASSSRRSSSTTWFESPVFSVGTNDEKVGMISAETTPVGLSRNAEQLEKDVPGSTTPHSSSVLAGRKRPSISMYGPSGMEDSPRPASGHEVSDGSNNRVHAMPLAFNADPLHRDGAEAARHRERRVHYLHHEEDLRRRYYHQDQQTMEEYAYVHAGAHAIQPMSRRHPPAPTRLSGRSVSPHQASPPPLHQRLQLRPSLHHDPHPPRDGRHEVESSYISSPTSPHAEDYLQGSYSYPQTPVQQHRPAPYYRQREYQPQPGSDPQGRLRQPLGRESMPPPEHHSGRYHPAYPSHPPQHPPHYQHYAYHPQPPPHSRQNPIPYPCEDDEAAGLSDVLRDPIRRKYY